MAGINAVMTGPSAAPVTVKGVVLVAVLAPTCTEIGPEVADAGTVATSCVCEAETTVAVTPLKVTIFADGLAPKPVPLIVTEAPTGPRIGENAPIDRVVSDRVI
jgi:hypothetical protein